MSEPRRPFSLTITAVGINLVAMWNLWRAWIVAQQLGLLQSLGPTLDPRVRLALALLWAPVFGLLGIGLWRGHRLARRVGPFAVVAYGALHLLFLFLFTPPAAHQSWPMQVLVLLAATGWTTWACLDEKQRAAWFSSGRRAALTFSFSPLTLKVNQRGYDGESKD